MSAVSARRKKLVNQVTVICYQPSTQEYLLVTMPRGTVEAMTKSAMSHYRGVDLSDIHVVTILDGVCNVNAAYESSVGTV